MSCCAPSRDGSAKTPVTPLTRGETNAADRVFFDGCRSFVGTDRPVIIEDGEGPRRPTKLAPFWLEATPVTNERFAAFVAATAYVTEAEQFGWSPVFQGLLSVDHRPSGSGQASWWVKVDGAAWSTPEGPGSSIADRQRHPVVHVSWADAKAFATWCGGRLPNEAEWEHAARGGLADPRFPWGNEEPDDDKSIHANIWQGQFPNHNTLRDGFLGTSPVRTFAANGAGLYDMIGNVWEWTADPFRVRSLSKQAKARNENASATQEKVLKGGSFLCHLSYCYRYRIAARSALTADSSSSNTGFRVAYNA